MSAFPVLYYTERPRTCTLHLSGLGSLAADGDLHLHSCAIQIFIQQERWLISFQHGVNYVLASCSFPSAVCKHRTTVPCQLRCGLNWQLLCFQHRLRRTAVNKVEQCTDVTHKTASSSKCREFIIYLWQAVFLFLRVLRKWGSAGLQSQSHQLYFLRDIRSCPLQKHFDITP